jgi:hypothetical protein
MGLDASAEAGFRARSHRDFFNGSFVGHLVHVLGTAGALVLATPNQVTLQLSGVKIARGTYDGGCVTSEF